jgi:hypothetical protein
MTKAKAKKPLPRRKAKPKRPRGNQPHQPTPQTVATCRAMAGVGYAKR